MLGQPSVIARLMGLEDAAVPATPPVTPIQQAEEGTMVNLLKPSSGDVRQPKCSPLSRHGRINGDYYRYCLSKMRPRLKSRRASSSRGHRRRDRQDRHHPQEELLEKIKEEFRASWQQASMAPSSPPAPEEEENAASASGRRSSGAGADRAGWVEVDGRYIQRVAQENLRREKMARYGHGGNGKAKVGDEDDEDDVKAPVKEAEEAEQQRAGSEGSEAKVAVSEEFFRALGPVVNGENDEHDDRTSNTSGNTRGTPTRIAILRPIGTTRAPAGSAGDLREPALGTAPPSWKAARDGGMEEFLRAVKERLNNELKAKTGNADMPPTTTTRRKGWGSEEAKGDTARQIREAMVSKEDLGRRLSRLESFRVFRGDRVGRCDATAVKSPEHRMLKSVRARIEAMSPKKTGRHGLIGCLSPVSSRGGRARSSPPADAGHASLLSGIGSDEENEEEEERRCCTGDQRRVMTTKPWKVHGAEPTDADVGVSPRALVRSLSAPAPSRFSDGGSETSCEGADAKLSRSRSFGHLRGTVASVLKRSFSLLLMHLTKKSPPSPQDSGNSITAATQADFLAGLPPSSPVSPLDVHGRSPRHFSGGFSCTFLPESSPRWSPKCSSEFGASVGGGAESPWRRRTDAAAESPDDPDRVYIRELLIAAGLFHDDDAGSSDTVAATIISGQVFDEVEGAYYYLRLRCRVDEDGAGEEEDGWPDRRRLLFELANEALQALQAGPSSTSLPSLLCQWIVYSGNGVSSSSSRLRLRGRDLEDEVWRRVAQAMTGDDDAPAPATTVDGMVEREVRKSPWMVLREGMCAVGRKVECAIFDELVADLVRQVIV